MEQASFLSLVWGTGAASIKLLNGTSITRSLASSEGETVEGNSPTNTETYEPQELQIEYMATASAGVQPLAEWEKVQKCLGKRGPLLIGGRSFGAAIFMLDSATITAEAITPQGKLLAATFSLKLTEDTYKATTPAAAKEQYIGQKAAQAPAVKRKTSGNSWDSKIEADALNYYKEAHGGSASGFTSAFDIRPAATDAPN